MFSDADTPARGHQRLRGHVRWCVEPGHHGCQRGRRRNAINHILYFVSFSFLSSNVALARACSIGIKDGESTCFALGEVLGDDPGDCAATFFLQKQCVSNVPSPRGHAEYRHTPLHLHFSFAWPPPARSFCQCWFRWQLPAAHARADSCFPCIKLHTCLSFHRHQRCQVSTSQGRSTLLPRSSPLLRMLATGVH